MQGDTVDRRSGKVESLAKKFPPCSTCGRELPRSDDAAAPRGLRHPGLFPDGVPSPELSGSMCRNSGAWDRRDTWCISTRPEWRRRPPGRGAVLCLADHGQDRRRPRALAGRTHSRLAIAGVSGSAIRREPGAGADGRGPRRLADAIAAAKGNMLELYIEDVFQWKSHPDIPPPEAITAQEARALFDHAASRQVEVHPAFQGFGHWDKILAKPAYRPLGVSGSTIDIRKPATVALVRDMVDDVRRISRQILQRRYHGERCRRVLLQRNEAGGLQRVDLPVVLRLREMVGRHKMRLMVMQGRLGNTGYLAGLGPVIGKMPKDVVIGSYYTAMGIYSGWEKDFPLLRRTGIDFFAQSWIWSHCWLMPEVSGSIRCSDAEVSRGLEHGLLGSITCDWGDFGHFQLVGQTWYPSVYHAASAWTGAKLDRDYFNRSFCRVFYGIKDDGVARSIRMLGDINVQPVKVREPSGKVVQAGSLHYWEFWNDPFADPNITKLAAPASTGEDILNEANPAASQLATAAKRASRNRDNLEQLLLCAAATRPWDGSWLPRAIISARKSRAAGSPQSWPT